MTKDAMKDKPPPRLPVEAAAKSLRSLGVSGGTDLRSLLDTVQGLLDGIAGGNSEVIREALAGQFLIQDILAQYCARRLGVTDEPVAAKVYGSLLIKAQAQAQSCKTLQMIDSIRAHDTEPNIFNIEGIKRSIRSD